MSEKFVAYYRVSTARQGASGLGLESQRADVMRYLQAVGGELLAEFTEVESGKRNNRPELSRALRLAAVSGATLVIAKLDRLSRNAAFLLNLRDSGVRFRAVDMPEANEMMVGIMALVAHHEGKAISERTRSGLQAAKARGTKLGNPNGAAALRKAGKGNAAAVASIKAKADQSAQQIGEYIREIRGRGITSMAGIARELNAMGARTPRSGSEWTHVTVARMVNRLEG